MLPINKKIRIILDTNLWISFLITDNYTKLDEILSSKRVQILTNQKLLDEFISVTTRPKFRKYFTEKDVDDLLARMSKQAKMVQTKTTVTHCRDPKDNYLLELAIDGNAHFLLTGDNDLLELKRIGKTAIIKIQDFLAQQ
jgi:putative PIN family toxin of toxin-antitoxin system